jgi:hypothetical protein
VRRDALAWHIIIDRQLIKETESLEGIIFKRLIGNIRADKAIFTKLEVLDSIFKT